jgi:hypothetical protein
MEEVFKIFFSVTEDEGERTNFPSYTSEAIEGYAAEFAAAMPPDIYSVAQIQCYLLRKSGIRLVLYKVLPSGSQNRKKSAVQ